MDEDEGEYVLKKLMCVITIQTIHTSFTRYLLLTKQANIGLVLSEFYTYQ